MINRLRRVELPLAALAVVGILAVLVIGVVTLVLLRDAGTKHELKRVEQHTAMAGRAVVEPLITPGVLRGDPAALAALDRDVRRHLLHDPVQRVKIWTADGRIVYSDEPRLIGERFQLEQDERAVLSSTGPESTSSLSDLDAPENRYERSDDEMLEVYTRMDGPDGEPLLFETYQQFEFIAASSRDLWLSLLPALLAGLVLLELANFAIARWFARRMRRADQQRVALLAKARDASSRERRRIAADLHDGVVQDLTAASLTVGGASRALDERAVGPATISALDEAADTMRESVGTLRTLLMDFYPADLEARGLHASLCDLAALARTRGAVAEVDAPETFRAPLDAEGLLYRVAQEGVRNAVTHSRASRVSIRAGQDDGRYWVEVQDDGVGFDPSLPAPDGHLGLRSLRDLVSDAGGGFVVDSGPGQGCVVRAEIPVVPDLTT